MKVDGSPDARKNRGLTDRTGWGRMMRVRRQTNQKNRLAFQRERAAARRDEHAF
jgi:hypothetical protein